MSPGKGAFWTGFAVFENAAFQQALNLCAHKFQSAGSGLFFRESLKPFCVKSDCCANQRCPIFCKRVIVPQGGENAALSIRVPKNLPCSVVSRIAVAYALTAPTPLICSFVGWKRVIALLAAVSLLDGHSVVGASLFRETLDSLHLTHF